MLYLLLAFGGTVPWLVIRFAGIPHNDYVQAFSSALCIVSSGFILTWASDSSRKYISGALAISFVALLAVLPEYAVDIYLSYKAGIDPEYTHYAVANMTGANRLLIGVGWPAILVVYLIRVKKVRLREFIEFEESIQSDLFVLLAATLWSFNIFFKKSISLLDTALLGVLFAVYIYRASKEMKEELEEEFEPVKTIVRLPKRISITLIVFMFIWAGIGILFSAEPFAESLIHIGRKLEISEFLLIQWIAPLASESPEFVVTLIWAVMGRGSDALRALISSKVNQWTLLIATIPVAFSISKFIHAVPNVFSGMPMDHRQQWEVFLTASQSLFAFFIIYDRKFSLAEALSLASLFFIQFFIEHIREEISFLYLALCIPFFIMKFYRKI